LRDGILATALIAVAMIATACGSSSESVGSSGQEDQQGSAEETTASPVEAVQVAYKTTTEAKTAKVEMDISGLPVGASSPGGPAGTTSIRTTGQGVIDFENNTADLTTQTPMGELEVR
jgi:hypothetical protein